MGIIPHRLHKKEIDELSYIFIALGMIFTIPQVIQLYQTQSAEDLSMLSWMAYVITGSFWLVYGFERKIRPIMVSASFHTLLNVIMLIGIIRFS